MFSQESVLLNNGFEFVKVCHSACIGTTKITYKRGNDYLFVVPKRNYFKLNGQKYALSLLEEKTR